MKEKFVYIKQLNKCKYNLKKLYNPPVCFPEYPFGVKGIGKNNVIYSELRNLLFEMNLDEDNYNTVKWNPFGEMIKPRDMAVLKQNMVMHKNGNKQFTTDCLITNGSIIKTILDYVCIALKTKGKIIIADAPL